MKDFAAQDTFFPMKYIFKVADALSDEDKHTGQLLRSFFLMVNDAYRCGVKDGKKQAREEMKTK